MDPLHLHGARGNTMAHKECGTTGFSCAAEGSRPSRLVLAYAVVKV